MSLILGIDIGGTTMKGGFIDPKGNLTARHVVPTPGKENNEVFLNALWELIRELLDSAGDAELIGMGIGAPGPPIHTGEGMIIQASNMPGVKNAPVVPFIREKLTQRGMDIKIKINNDANAAALGQMYFGAGKEFANFAVITLGTGVGGGLILNKRLFSGYHGNAFEAGHIPVFYPGNEVPPRRCGCGSLGCLETIASATGIKAYYKLFTGQEKRSIEIVDLAKAGDPDAKKVYHIAGWALGHVAVSLVHILNLEAIIFTGGLAKAKDLLLPEIEAITQERVFPFLRERLKIIFTEGDENSGIKGAASLLFDYA